MRLNLRHLRKSKKITQAYIAERCGISQQLYRAYESGKVQRPYLAYLDRFCQVLDCGIGDLFIRD